LQNSLIDATGTQLGCLKCSDSRSTGCFLLSRPALISNCSAADTARGLPGAAPPGHWGVSEGVRCAWRSAGRRPLDSAGVAHGSLLCGPGLTRRPLWAGTGCSPWRQPDRRPTRPAEQAPGRPSRGPDRPPGGDSPARRAAKVHRCQGRLRGTFFRCRGHRGPGERQGGDSAKQRPPEQRQHLFLLPAYDHHIIGSPGIAEQKNGRWPVCRWYGMLLRVPSTAYG
jgi:hypothetical protein